MKALFLYSGQRKEKYNGVASVDYPDTQFYGLTYMKDFGVDAEYKEYGKTMWARSVGKILGFRFRHAYMYFVARRYDVVFGISIVYMLVLKKIFPTKTKFVLFNSVLNRMLRVHKPGSFSYRFLISLLRELDGIIFLSQAHLKRVVDKVPFIENNSFFVPMGVDAKYFKPIYQGRENFYLAVGRDNARDYKTIIDVARAMPEESFHLVCLPRNVRDIENIPSNVMLHYDIPRNELQELYENARALLLIMHDDTYPEGSDSSGPTVLLEAMAVGLPIVVSKKEYLSDYVTHGEDAFLVDFYDKEGIIQSIKVLQDPILRTKIALNARAKVDLKFNTREMAKGIAEVFKIIYGR
jgi:glycosyltransferase involved in cell wall biosynthesis